MKAHFTSVYEVPLAPFPIAIDTTLPPAKAASVISKCGGCMLAEQRANGDGAGAVVLVACIRSAAACSAAAQVA